MDTPKTLLTFLFIFLGFSAYAQITFEKRYDYEFAEAAHDIQQTSDGGYIIVGRQGISIGITKILLIKTDNLGNEVWHRLYDEYLEQFAFAVNQTGDGGFIIAGNTSGEDGPGSFRDAYLIKTNSSGDTLWTKTYGGSNAEGIFDMELTQDNGYILVGSSRSFGDGDLDVYLTKMNSLGIQEWTKTFGGSKDDVGRSVKQTTDGGFIIAGYINTDDYSAQAYLIRTNEEGDTLWTNTFGWDKAEFGNDVIETEDGGFLMVGQTAEINPLINYDKYLVRTNAQGDSLWTKIINSSGNKGENISSISKSSDGGYVLGGTDHNEIEPSTKSSMFLLKMDQNGNVIWDNKFGGYDTELGYAMISTQDGGFALVGLSDSDCGSCVYFVKTGPDGDVITSLNLPIIEDFKVDIYPNPASKQFTLSFQVPEPGFLQIDLYDLHGRLILPISKADRTTNQYKEQVNVKDLTSGLYLLRFLDSDGAVLTKKIIIQ